MKFSYFALIAFASLLLGNQAQALSTDRDQPADIQADDAEYDFKKGTRTLIGDVIIIQGTLRIKADKVFAKYDGSELVSATAWGSPARFKQRPDNKPDDVEGSAQKIIVDQKQNTLTLIGSASLKQGPETARSDTIIYNMANDTLRLKGKAKVGATGKNGESTSSVRNDPFAEDDAARAREAAAKANIDSPTESLDTETVTTNDNSAEESADVKPAPVEKPRPVRSGRSRLILQPK